MLLLRLYRTLKTAVIYWVEDSAAQMGAALAYYLLFSLAPILLIAIAVAGLVFGEAAAQGHVVAKIGAFIGEESSATVETMLENFRQPAEGPWAAIVSGASLWYGALGVFTQLRSSLSRIWRLKPMSQYVIAGFLKDYLLAFVMVLVSSTFVLTLLTASTCLTAVLTWSSILIPISRWVCELADFLLSWFLVGLMFGLTYRFMSDGQVRYGQVWGGAIMAAMLFAVGKMAIGFYLAHSLLSSAYGAAGSLVVFLVWVYYSAQIFFFGAEVIRVRLEH
jgi:membrane protein